MDPKDFSHNAPGSLQFHPDGFWCFLPYALPPMFRWSDRLVTSLSGADLALARLAERLSGLGQGFPAMMARLEAAASSRLAGSRVSAQDVFRFEAGYQSAVEAGSGQDAAALRLAEAMLEGCNGAVPDLNRIAGLHAGLWPGPEDPGRPPGVFRSGLTWLGGEEPGAAEFVPPPPEAMWESLEALEGFIASPPGLPPLVQLALVHYQVEVIRPFFDANGRLNRLLLQVLLSAWAGLAGPGLAMSEYIERHLREYRSLLAAVRQENAWEPWLVFFLSGLKEEAGRSLELAGDLAAWRAGWAHRAPEGRTAKRTGRVLDEIRWRPYLSVRQVEGMIPGGNFKSAARCVDRLVALGVLEEVTGQGRHRVFRVKGLPVL